MPGDVLRRKIKRKAVMTEIGRIPEPVARKMMAEGLYTMKYQRGRPDLNRKKILALAQHGMGPVDIARLLEYPMQTGSYKGPGTGKPTWTFYDDYRQAVGMGKQLALEEKARTEPKSWDELTDEAKSALEQTPEGFRRFCNLIWPEQPMPEHIFRVVQAAYDYEAGETHLCPLPGHDHIQPKGEWKSNLILNIGPGHAKSSYFSRRWAIWRLSHNRNWRFGIVSETQSLASDWTAEIGEELESNEILLENFGAFRSDIANTWRVGHGQLKVLGASTRVRWSVIARGREQSVQGVRLDEVVIDDPETPDSIMNLDDRDKVVKRIDYVLQNRLEPETGLLRLIATRFDLRDIPGILAERRYDDGTPVWEHVSFPALYDPETGEPTTGPEAVSLWAERFSVEFLRKEIQRLGPVIFDMVYQQIPRPEGSATFNMAWITGPEGADKEDPRAGCLDRDRTAGEPADDRHWAGEKIRCFSLDPSGTAGYWAMIVADVPSRRDTGDFGAVIADIRRGKWTTSDFLDQVADIGAVYHPSFFIPESNMRADLWNGQNPDFNKLKAEYGFQTKSVHTLMNKRDLLWGVKSLALEFLNGRIRLPWADEQSRAISKLLITEVYEHPHGRTDDVLMALWFMKAVWRSLPSITMAESGYRDVWGPVGQRMAGERW